MANWSQLKPGDGLFDTGYEAAGEDGAGGYREGDGRLAEEEGQARYRSFQVYLPDRRHLQILLFH